MKPFKTFLVIACFGVPDCASLSPVVHIERTPVFGTVSRLNPEVEAFLGIPYAISPVSKRRFLPSSIKDIGSEPVNATAYGPGCLQLDTQDSISEDCLTLNILRSNANKKVTRLPVFLWIHGGDFIAGASSGYDGTNIVTRAQERGTPIIFVSINYRLGPLGFPVGEDAADEGVLNLGLKDQLIALEWVQRYIRFFDGDENKVTVVGESAGAHSIDIHLLGTSLRQYARGAILQSTYWDPQYGPDRNADSWDSFVQAIPGCVPTSQAQGNSGLECLRTANVTSDAILEAWSQVAKPLAFNPVIDGPNGLLIDLPSQITPKSRLPVIVGSNLDEGTLFTPQDVNSTDPIRSWLLENSTPSPRGSEALASAVERLLNEVYPNDPVIGSPFGAGNETFGLDPQYKRWAAIWGDFAIEAHIRELRYLLGSLDLPVYGYRFADSDAQFPDIGQVPGSLGVPHASELPYVFGDGATFLGNLTTSDARHLSEIMMDYWISFVTSLTPNDEKNVHSPPRDAYTRASQIVMQFNGTRSSIVSDGWRAEAIGFISQDPVLWHR